MKRVLFAAITAVGLTACHDFDDALAQCRLNGTCQSLDGGVGGGSGGGVGGSGGGVGGSGGGVGGSGGGVGTSGGGGGTSDGGGGTSDGGGGGGTGGAGGGAGNTGGGTGGAADLKATAGTPVDVGEQSLGSSKGVGLTNFGTAPASGVSASPGSAFISVIVTSCEGLAPGGVCQAQVKFVSAPAGTFTSSFSLQWDGGSSTVQVKGTLVSSAAVAGTIASAATPEVASFTFADGGALDGCDAGLCSYTQRVGTETIVGQAARGCRFTDSTLCDGGARCTFTVTPGGAMVVQPVVMECMNFAFITSQRSTGNLGGFSGADTMCQVHAADAGFPLASRYRALLSTDGGGFPTATLGSGSGWVRADGMPLAKDAPALIAAQLFTAPGVDEKGVAQSSATQAWTGIGSSVPNCQGWTMSGNLPGGVGDPLVGGGATVFNAGQATCSTGFPIYCVGTAFSTNTSLPGPPAGKVMFLSATPFSPNAGYNAATTICTSDAQNSPLPVLSSRSTKFQAVMHHAGLVPFSGFPTDGGPYSDPDGLVIFRRDTDTGPLASVSPLSATSNGSHALGGVWVGQPGADCSDWSSAMANGALGDSNRMGTGALLQTNPVCNLSYRVYCAER